MPATGDMVFPLIPLRKSRALEVAGRASRHRGVGEEIASSRPYRRGDAIRSVDWGASARLSTARGRDEFVVRDHYAEDVVRVVVVIDRGPSMGLFPDWLPWLHKPTAVREAAAMIIASGAAVGALIGYAEAAEQGLRVDRPGRDRALRRAIEQRARDGEANGPPDSLELALASLLGHRSSGVPVATFVFVLSDFLPGPSLQLLRNVVETGWDVVPVVVQDPVWERSFPDVAGVTLPLAHPSDRALTLVRLNRKETRERCDANELRAVALDQSFRELGLDAVILTTDERRPIYSSFLKWAERRDSRTRRYR
jgi:uncharacterized protein (DUF58 family)